MSRVRVATARPNVARDFVDLTKPGITSLVLCTTTGGLWLAPGHIDRLRALVVVLTTAGVVSGANALNQYLERDIDGLMTRTRNRPLPQHRLDSRLALLFGLALAIIAVPALTFAGGWLSGGLAFLALFSYVAVYTPMKRISPMAVFVGAIPGAIPPLIGWTTLSGKLDLGGLSLFAILFFWQIPHFLAIALYREREYAAAGFRIFPTVHGDRATRIHIVLWSIVLVAATLAPYALHIAGARYLTVAGVLGAVFLWGAFRGLMEDAGPTWARQLFLGSILHLTLIFTALVLDALH